MMSRAFIAAAIAAGFGACLAVPASAADIDYGKSGSPVKVVVGYQPYYTQAWTGVVMRGKKFYEKYLPNGSNVEFQVGLQGAIISNNMLAGKIHIGYMGDMPSINATSHPEVADLRIVSTLGLGYDQCNAFLVRTDAPKFKTGLEALKWLHGKRVAVPKGSCTDRFAQTVFKEHGVQPAEYLNQNIEVITSGFRAGKLDAAVMWEPTTARLELEGLARRVSTGFDFKQIDGGFLVMRLDLIKGRPDVVKAWLNAELDAQLYLVDTKNAAEITRMAKEQTTGFSEKSLWYSLYGSYGRPKDVRLLLHYAITPEARDLLIKGSQFLHSIKSIKYPQIRAEAIMPQFADEVLKERGMKAPLGEILPLPDSAFKGTQ
jgi:NitT/TauT family transport system substrate-binding protein